MRLITRLAYVITTLISAHQRVKAVVRCRNIAGSQFVLPLKYIFQRTGNRPCECGTQRGNGSNVAVQFLHFTTDETRKTASDMGSEIADGE